MVKGIKNFLRDERVEENVRKVGKNSFVFFKIDF